MIRAVIFDVDGTLVDSVDYHARAWQQAFSEFGVDVRYADVRSQIGKGGDQLMPEFLTPEQLERFGEKLEKFRGELYKSRYLPRVQAFPRVRELMLHLKERGTGVALATSAPEDELSRLEKIARIEDVVEVTTSKDDAEKSKPHPDIFEAALEQLSHPSPRETVVIGDSPFDAIAARKLGLTPIGLLSGGFSPEELREAGCVALFRDPADLLAHARPTADAWLERPDGHPHV